MSDEQRAAYLALATTSGIGPVRLHTLLSAFSTPLGALSAPFAHLCALPGVSRAAATAIRQASVGRASALLERLSREGSTVLLGIDDVFPDALRTIPDPPAVLFAQGRTELLAKPAVALVGSRNHTAYGDEVCRSVARTAVEHGLTVVSGMARGLDAAAHEAALAAEGDTIGVLGNGLGVVYPAANRSLYDRVARAGLLLTEFPPGERPHAGSFPRRNRIISGLARVTVVVEAAAASGALITAGSALDQGREVMAVPGPITSPSSVGTNRLLRDGATPLLEPEDLLAHYADIDASPTAKSSAATSGTPREAPSPLVPDLPDAERRMLALVAGEPRHVDEIALASGQPAGEVLALLCALELTGAVVQRPGRLFQRA